MTLCGEYGVSLDQPMKIRYSIWWSMSKSMYSLGKKEAGTCPEKKTTMAGDSSLASELIQAINLPNLKPIPPYLSEADAMSVREYLQTGLCTRA